jgi:predicted 3-demethylubiquinone-9 3-methyltransferase (glyoxalase superfamily)
MKSKKVTPFLWFNDNAYEAAQFYVKTFKHSRILAVSGRGKQVQWVRFSVEGQELMALNGGAYFKLSPAISLFVDCEDQKEVDALWKKLTRGGEESRCGWLVDKFGLSWQIIPRRLMQLLSDPDPQRAQRAQAEMMKMRKIDVAALERAAGAPAAPAARAATRAKAKRKASSARSR